MATSGGPADEDPIEDEMRRVLADPGVRASLDNLASSQARGDVGDDVPNEEVRRMLGLSPHRFAARVRRRPRLLNWSRQAREDQSAVVAAAWNQGDADLVAEVMYRMATRGWSFGREVEGRPSVRYSAMPPLAVLYSEQPGCIRVLRVVAPDRLHGLPD